MLLIAAAAALAGLYWYMQQQQGAAIGGVTVEPMPAGGSPSWSAWAGSTAWPSSSPAGSPSPSATPFQMVSSSPAGTPAPAWAANGPFSVSPDGRAFIKTKEGLRLRAYGDAGKFSIGYGHQLGPGESYPNGITPAQADALFDGDVSRIERAINQGVTVTISQPQYDALASFAYNVGVPAFLGSTLLRKLNAGDYAGAAAQFPAWNKSQGQVLSVLIARRADEQAMFMVA